jgi:valyl-tRNA synthetase
MISVVWYLEWVKPGFDQSIDETVYSKTIDYFGQLMQLLHPFMPFISEEIYHLLKEQKDDLCIKQFGAIGKVDEEVLKTRIAVNGIDHRNSRRKK